MRTVHSYSWDSGWITILFYSVVFCSLCSAEPFSQPLRFREVDYCCDKKQALCEDGCSGGAICLGPDCNLDINCLAKCIEAHCRAGKSCIEPEAGLLPPGLDYGSPYGLKETGGTPDRGEIRHDGRLLAPGTVDFDIKVNTSQVSALRLYGVVHGHHKNGGQQVLKKTNELVVFPGAGVTPKIEVSPEEFTRWSKQFEAITVGMEYVDPSDASDWKYRNLLTEKDTLERKPGEFKVKGEFIPVGK